jgi:prepilin-type N-terminal cleavage/methylation domain-containing protein
VTQLKKKYFSGGFTLTELVVTVFIMGILAYVTPMAIKLLNGLKYQQQMAQANQQIEIFIGLLSQDINNSPKFVENPFPDKLRLFAINARDFSLNEDCVGCPQTLNSSLFGEIQYKLEPKSGKYCIRRSVTFWGPCAPEPCVGPVIRSETKDFLTGFVLPPAAAGHPIFSLGLDRDTIIFDLSFFYPFQNKSGPPKRFVKNILKWSNYAD